ncbi:alpha/beta hydrolase [Noviherbaspirillum galbum]|uniref:Alpha/beta fold hydrolase n=1 Tax=Noviherbaspirillum galbum TaxID=2709383 RepID=A0A6B3SVT0_9BURK|nr:alpha/beta fold hydrolase [Noviherbaspirillum galbum]NEX64857.1 alpha/beta fold hydrolase [Noviherbaspirillum galbum]
MKTIVRVSIPLVVLLVALAAAIAFGGPVIPPTLHSVSDPFRTVDFSDLPAARGFVARDNTRLAYRAYLPASNPRGSVVLVHGSAGSSTSMHVLAKALSKAGFAVYALDIRGHGDSGIRGEIGYVGQLEDDLEDFVHAVKPASPATLGGFSSGGGFALRFAGDRRQKLFASYLLLSPYIGYDAPTRRKASGGWVSVGVPRYVAISLLNRIHLHSFDDLPVIRFAIDDAAERLLTPTYSYALIENFEPLRDYRKNIRAAAQPMRIVAGQEDELFFADQFDGLFKSAGRPVPVTLVPGVGHIPLTLKAEAVAEVVRAKEMMDARPEAQTAGLILRAAQSHPSRQPVFAANADAAGAQAGGQ